MRLYFKELPEYIEIDLTPTIEHEHQLYSNDGIYVIKENELFKLDIKEHKENKENKAEEFNYIDYQFIQDYTTYCFSKTFHIPNNYIEHDIVKEIYDLEWIQLIIEKHNNKIEEAFIEIKDKTKYKEDLSTLLLKIK